MYYVLCHCLVVSMLMNVTRNGPRNDKRCRYYVFYVRGLVPRPVLVVR